MKKNIVISIIMIVVLLMSTFSYASTEVSVETIEESLRKLFAQEIQISGSGELQNGTAALTMEAIQVDVGTSKIVIKDENLEKLKAINYILEDNSCRFESKYEITSTEGTSLEEAFQEAQIMMKQQLITAECYLATADALGKDLSLAYTYFQQKYNEDNQENSSDDSYTITDDVFTMEVAISETESTVFIEIDLEKMAELNEDKLDSTSKYIVTLSEANEEQDPLPDEETNNEQENKPSDEQQGNDNIQNEIKDDNNIQNEVKDEQEESKNNIIDDTQIKTEIPKTGTDNVICIGAIISIITLILYLQNKKQKDIE